jgi:hypothetical protein
MGLSRQEKERERERMIYAEPRITHLYYVGILLDYSLALWNVKIIMG